MQAFHLHNDCMATLTIRDVPDDVRESLSRDARERGQSLQAFLLGVLRRQASFGRNRQILGEVDRDLASGGGAGPDAPDAAELIDEARTENAVGVRSAVRPRRRPAS